MRADGRAVSDRDEISEFGATPDAGFAYGGPLNCAIAADFNVILEYNDAVLGNFVVFARMCGVAESIIADDHACMQCDSVPENAVFVYDGIGKKNAVISNDGTRADPDAWVEVAATPDRGPSLDNSMGMNVRAVSNFGRRVDYRPSTDSRSIILHRIWMLTEAQ